METSKFWAEELRSFPYGGGGAALWVVRRRGSDSAAPLRLIFSWEVGCARGAHLAAQPPLGALLRAMAGGRAELVRREGEAALWLEPLEGGGHDGGCLGLWFDAPEPWREAIFLWAQRLGARLGPLLDRLEPLAPAGAAVAEPQQRSLFAWPPPGAAAVPARPLPGPRDPERGLIPLPRPVAVPGIPGCIGGSREMEQLGASLGAIARSDVNVLLHGESGTGKEIVARALHLCSARGKGPFVGQNCAALPESLFESELFGHCAGAFTGAAGEKKGLLAAASGGTFFLDEIGDMPLVLQIKLLRVMQERRVRRIGEVQGRPVDLRFIAATHKDLEQEIEAGRFRLDLYFRLKVVHLQIPALRHRPEDVAPLFSFFLRKLGRDVDNMWLTDSALASLQAWRWPGNVRELENEAARFSALYPDRSTISLSCLSPEIRSSRSGRIDPADLGTLRQLDQANEILERYLIRKAIAATCGRKAAAARRLGLSRQGLYKKIQRYGMTDLIGAAGD